MTINAERIKLQTTRSPISWLRCEKALTSVSLLKSVQSAGGLGRFACWSGVSFWLRASQLT